MCAGAQAHEAVHVREAACDLRVLVSGAAACGAHAVPRARPWAAAGLGATCVAARGGLAALAASTARATHAALAAHTAHLGGAQCGFIALAKISMDKHSVTVLTREAY